MADIQKKKKWEKQDKQEKLFVNQIANKVLAPRIQSPYKTVREKTNLSRKWETRHFFEENWMTSK